MLLEYKVRHLNHSATTRSKISSFTVTNCTVHLSLNLTKTHPLSCNYPPHTNLYYKDTCALAPSTLCSVIIPEPLDWKSLEIKLALRGLHFPRAHYLCKKNKLSRWRKYIKNKILRKGVTWAQDTIFLLVKNNKKWVLLPKLLLYGSVNKITHTRKKNSSTGEFKNV